MPSSLLFAGLVATWLVVLVPMAARRRQPVTRPSDAALSSRVLERPARDYPAPAGRGSEEVSMSDTGAAGPRFRPGRGGYDPEAAQLAARARATFRQRMVLALVLLAVSSALVAVGLTMPEVWWVHGATDVILLVYLVNLRRQVRTEQRIHARRAARLAGSRGRNPDLHAGDTRSREPNGRAEHGPQPHGRVLRRGRDQRQAAALDGHLESAPRLNDPVDEPGAKVLADLVEEPVEEIDPADIPALPLLAPVPLPPLPAGTEVLELDDEDPEMHYLDHHEEHWGYRRAAGQ